MVKGLTQEETDPQQQEEQEIESEEEEERGYGGIKMASVGEIIAKARFNESYLHVNLGLGENLEELANRFGSKENGVCVCVCVCVRNSSYMYLCRGGGGGSRAYTFRRVRSQWN